MFLRPRLAADIQAVVAAGQHQIENDQIIGAAQRQIEAVVAIVRHIDDMALFGEDTRHQPRQSLFVFHDKNMHSHRLRRDTIV